MDKSRNIYVAGNYIASQTIGTQILHADRVYTNNPDKEQPHEVEDVAFEEVGANAPVSRAAQYPFVDKFDVRLARHYFITGKRGEVKRIQIEREMVIWE